LLREEGREFRGRRVELLDLGHRERVVVDVPNVDLEVRRERHENLCDAPYLRCPLHVVDDVLELHQELQVQLVQLLQAPEHVVDPLLIEHELASALELPALWRASALRVFAHSALEERVVEAADDVFAFVLAAAARELEERLEMSSVRT